MTLFSVNGLTMFGEKIIIHSSLNMVLASEVLIQRDGCDRIEWKAVVTGLEQMGPFIYLVANGTEDHSFSHCLTCFVLQGMPKTGIPSGD